MNRQLLPTLELVRVFEAVARHRSVTKAASELFVTQSAVSHRMRQLEEHLGTALLVRQHRGIELTESGTELYRAAADALARLGDAVQRISRRVEANALSVTTTIGFASLWLIPRLGDFQAGRPDTDIRILADNRTLDLDAEHVDVAIRYCVPAQAPENSIRLFGEEVFPVCSPALLARGPAIENPSDLARHVLLHYERSEAASPWLSWSVWLETMGVAGLKPAGALRFMQFDQVVRAALDGHGIALGTTPLVRQAITAGTLVAPFRGALYSERAYYVATSRSARKRTEVLDFIGWLAARAHSEDHEASDDTTAGRSSPTKPER